MSRPAYQQSGNPVGRETGFSQQIRDEFDLIQAGLEELRNIWVIYHVPDPHKGAGYEELFALPRHPNGLRPVLEKATAVNSAANGASSMPTFLYTSGGLLQAKSFLPSDPAETVLVWDLRDFDETYRRLLQVIGPPPANDGDYIRLQIQGDLVTTMPVTYSFLIKWIQE